MIYNIKDKSYDAEDCIIRQRIDPICDLNTSRLQSSLLSFSPKQIKPILSYTFNTQVSTHLIQTVDMFSRCVCIHTLSIGITNCKRCELSVPSSLGFLSFAIIISLHTFTQQIQIYSSASEIYKVSTQSRCKNKESYHLIHKIYIGSALCQHALSKVHPPFYTPQGMDINLEACIFYDFTWPRSLSLGIVTQFSQSQPTTSLGCGLLQERCFALGLSCHDTWVFEALVKGFLP